MTRTLFIRSVLATLVLLTGRSAWAGIDPEPFRTGLFGIAAGQAIRVSLLNGGEGGVINPCFNPATAIAAVRIRGQRGAVLFTTRTEKVGESEGSFVDVVPFTDVRDPSGARTPGGLPVNRRLQVYVDVVVLVERDDAVPPGEPLNVILTLEVYDAATGRTEFTMPFVEVGGIEPTPF
jgi:hypothetical protein